MKLRPAKMTRTRGTARAGILLLALAAVLVLAACGGDTSTSASASATPDATSAGASGGDTGYTDISPDQLATMLEEKDFLLINTHVPYEGEIERTDLFLPYDQASELVDKLPADKGAKIVVYCRTDHMSRIAADAWAAAGYTNLYNLDGGFVAWKEAGYPLLQKDRQ